MTNPKTRQSKTPAQRAQEAVDVLRRRIDRLTEKLNDVDADLAENRRRLDYAKQNPDLPTQPTQDTTTGAHA